MSLPLPVVDGDRVQIFMGADSPDSFPSQRPTAEELMDLFFQKINQRLLCFALLGISHSAADSSRTFLQGGVHAILQQIYNHRVICVFDHTYQKVFLSPTGLQAMLFFIILLLIVREVLVYFSRTRQHCGHLSLTCSQRTLLDLLSFSFCYNCSLLPHT